MDSPVDPYEVLGVARDASAEDVKRAFHKAVLECHPDSRPGDPRAAERFSLVTESYRTVMRTFSRAEQTFMPSDFARMGAWQVTSPQEAEAAKKKNPLLQPFKISYSTLHETGVFVMVWLAALFVCLAVICWIARVDIASLLRPASSDIEENQGSFLEIVKMALPAILVYGSMLVGAIFLILLSRKIVWFVRQWRLGRLLPSPPKELDETKKIPRVFVPPPPGQAEEEQKP